MEKFKFEMEALKSITVEAESLEDAKEQAKKIFLKALSSNDIKIIDYGNLTEWENMLSKCRENVIEYIDNNIKGLAESHVEGWKERYFGKTKDDIIFDLDVNHDISLEVEDVEYGTSTKLNDEEYEYLCEVFKEAVLDEIFQ